jgi:serine/threonine protein kinase
MTLVISSSGEGHGFPARGSPAQDSPAIEPDRVDDGVLTAQLPIDRRRGASRLPLRQRLELFVPVCHALQHDHQKGIVRRGLKPSNVLVAPYDEAGTQGD